MSNKKKETTGREITPEDLWNEDKMKKIAEVIAIESKKITPEQRLRTQVVAIRYKMYTYLDDKDVKEKMQILDFIKMYLKVLNISQSEFAFKIGMKVSNMHKYFTGERKLNTDIVMKLSAFSRTKPELWYSIQNKNDLLGLERSKAAKYRKYDYEKLIPRLLKHTKTKSGSSVPA